MIDEVLKTLEKLNEEDGKVFIEQCKDNLKGLILELKKQESEIHSELSKAHRLLKQIRKLGNKDGHR